MSKTVDLFIESDQPIDGLAEILGAATGWPVEPGEEPGTWSVRHGEVRADLHRHPFVNDGPLAFERYPFALTAQVDGSRLTESPQASMLRAVADRLREQRIPTMLVHDLQFRDQSGPGGGCGVGDEAP